MALFLLEFQDPGASRGDVRTLVDRVALAVGQSGGEFVEAQVTANLQRVYLVVEHGDAGADGEALGRALDDGGLPGRLVARVRLVGATLDEIKAAQPAADYLVEWDFPAGLTMDAYLARKRASAPRYAAVPEVRFLRTYVCEDMSRCLCLYLAHDETAVRRAREAVGAQVSRLNTLAPSGPGSTPWDPAAPAGGTRAAGGRGDAA